MRTNSLGNLAVVAALVSISVIATATAQSPVPSTKEADRTVRTGYAPVNGLEIYYEIHGEADPSRPPLALLHGGGDTIGTSFGRILPELARDRQVIAFEQQGYGRTADIVDRPFTFEQSADDAAALLEHLKVERADFFGFSNGGTIAMQIAIRHPEIVRRIVAASALLKRDGAPPPFWEFMANARLENMPQELQQSYLEVAPHPENLRLFHDKAAQRMRDFKDIPEESIRGVAAPTLIVVGDGDVVTPEHAVETFRLLPNAQLAILPNTDHMQVTSCPELPAMLRAFLDSREK